MFLRTLIVLSLTLLSLYAKPSRHFTLFTFSDDGDFYFDMKKKIAYHKFEVIKKMLDKEREGIRHHFTILLGDIISPHLLSQEDGGKQIIHHINKMKIDAAVIGNHELDFGYHNLIKRMTQSQFPWLASNLVKTNNEPVFIDNQVFWICVDDIKIAVIGLTDFFYNDQKSLYVLPAVYTAKKICKKITNKADLIIAATHLSIDQLHELIKHVPEINLAMTNHDKQTMVVYDQGCWILAQDKDFVRLCRIDVTVKKDNRDGVEMLPSFRMLFPEENEKPEEKVVVEENFFLPLIKLKQDSNHKTFHLRQKEALLAQLFVDGLRHETKADLALIPAGSMRSNKKYQKNTVIFGKDVYKEFIFNNKIVLLEIKGHLIEKMINKSLNNWEDNSGDFLHVSNMTYSFNPALKKGFRLVSTMFKGKKIDPQKTYKVATLDYVAKAKGCFRFLEKEEKEISYNKKRIAALLIEYFSKNSPKQTFEERIHLIN